MKTVMNLTKKEKIDIVENAISWIVVLAMFIYGGGKIVQFQDAVSLDKTVAEMTGMQLMWAFYGYSKAFVMTLGILEVFGGILILIKKTRLIGCLLTSSILINVILQDIFYGVHVGALKAAILYQLLIFVILWLNKDKVIAGVKSLLIFDKIQQPKSRYFIKLVVAFCLFFVLRIVEYYLTMKG